MRFRSLRASINGDLRQLSIPNPGKDTEADMEGTLNSNSMFKGHPPKARKTVVGLFDTPSQPARDGGAEPGMMTSNPASPALSLLDLPAGSLFTARPASHGPTLGSELGSDYGGDYAENHHLRSSSLYDVFLSGPSSTSRPATPSPPDTQVLSDPLLVETQPSKPPQDLDKTPQKLSVRASHQHRLSDTIRARTHYWVDRRFRHTAPVGRMTNVFGPDTGNGSLQLQDSIPDPRPAVTQAAVQTMPCDTKERERERDLAVVKVDRANASQSTPEALEPKRSRAMKVVLEVWLWMQFVVIIMVFLWAVTKRGPRNVLRNVKRVE